MPDPSPGYLTSMPDLRLLDFAVRDVQDNIGLVNM
jgi:hypothetical protein